MRRIGIAALGVMLAAPLCAQGPDLPAKLSLEEALRIAEARNPQVVVSQQVVVGAEADLIAAKKRPNPIFAFTSEGVPLSEPNRPSFFNNQELIFTLQQELETGGRRGFRTDQAQRGVEASRAVAQDALRRLRLDVQRAYLQVVLAKADDEVARTTLDEIDKVLAINRARYEQGELSGVELRRLQVERFRFADDVFASELALKNTRSALLALLNVKPLDQAFDPVDGFPSTPPTATQTEGAEAVIARALAGRPDVQAARKEQDAAHAAFQLQGALGKPPVSIGAGFKRDFGVNGFVFNVGIPLPLFNTNQGGVARAGAEERQAAARVSAIENAAALEVQQALNAVDISRRRAIYAENEYLKNAMEARDIVLASYKNAAATLIDYLDAERSLREALRVRNRTRFDYQISLFQYEAAVGVPGPSQGKEPQ